MDSSAYNHNDIESFWQKRWNDLNCFKFNNDNLDGKQPYYVLEMFPYPSGKIHMGHVRNYTIGDVIARTRMMQGYKVLHPMGFDAFGLPAENAAIETNSHPKKWTLENIEQMKATIKKLGFGYDWDREIATCLPNYYKYEQEMFIKFYEAGLAYQKKSFVNWDPVDNTVLANEQVIDGKGWRSGAKVERKELKQWFLKVSDFSEDLLNDLDTLPQWEEKVKTMQKNWIGKSQGAEVVFKIEENDLTNTLTTKHYEIKNSVLNKFETKNLIAKIFTANDFNLLYSLHSNPDVMKNIGNGKPKTKPEVEEQLANILNSPQNAVFAIFDKQTNTFVGRAGFSKFNSIIKSDADIDGYELGYCLMPEFWGKGYARELSFALLDLFFNKLKISDQIYAKTTDRNDKSISNLLSLNFEEHKAIKSDMQSPAKIYTLNKNTHNNSTNQITVFTTRADTLYGASFIAISPFHPIINNFSTTLSNQVHSFIEKQRNIKVSNQDIETLEKEGVFTGLYATNPLLGIQHNQVNDELFDIKLDRIPIYIANFVLMDYGTGAVFGCPAHDERDFEFANKYNLPIRQVVGTKSNSVIESKRLTFSLTNPANENDITKLHSDPNVIKYLDGYVDNPQKYTQNTKNKVNLAIYNRQNNEFIGRAGIYKFDTLNGKRHTEQSLTEIAYIFNKNSWGSGYGTEAAKALANFCFTNLGEEKICAVIDANHEQSRKILEKIGFKHKNTAFINSTYGNESYFELTNSNFYSLCKAEEFLSCLTQTGFAINSSSINCFDSSNAKNTITQKLAEANLAKPITNYKLRDWGVSRQRYWGCPIPMIYCINCGVTPEALKNLPVELPDDVDLTKAGSPLANHPTWKNCKCPKCGDSATRETDTFDTFFESSWYFLRFLYPNLKTAGFDSKNVDKFLPVNEYIGGIEHAILHLLYARFFVKALKKIGMLNTSEPFKRLITQGMICHKTYKDRLSGKWISPEDAKKLPQNQVEIGDSIKMSKSKKNIVDPEEIIAKYGADTARLFVLSDSPPDKDIDWSEEGINGSYRFIKKLYSYCVNFSSTYKDIKNIITEEQIKQTKGFKIANKYLYEYNQAFDTVILNKCVAKCRELFNSLTELTKNEDKFVALNYLIKMLNPIIPHICEQIWQILGNEDVLCCELLPTVDVSALEQSTIIMAVQVNGKLRASIEVPKDLNEASVIEIAKKNQSVQHQLINKEIKKVIFIANKVINIIIL